MTSPSPTGASPPERAAAMGAGAPPSWRSRLDVWVVAAVVLGLLLRWAPHAVWGFGSAVRDEAMYRNLARGIVNGEGLGVARGWLWAPGYPYLIAAFELLPWPATVGLPYAQGLLGALSCVTMYAIGRRVFDRRVGRIAAMGYALHPTLIYLSGRFWCEAVYGPVLLLAVLATLWAREGPARRAVVPGVLLGVCILLRGVAQVLPPVFVLAMLAPEGAWSAASWRAALRRRGRSAALLLLGAGLAVGPYSMHASARHGGFLVSDATVGNLMYLGNNDFQPITFDYGNGLFRMTARRNYVQAGRKACPRGKNPVRWNRCEVRRGLDWIQDNPGEFARRVPLRVAQLLNPHTFLTRALRWGKFDGLPWWAKEGLIACVVGWSFAVMGLGTVGAVGRARGPYAVLAWGAVLSTVAASAALYGLTRFRAPVEPLWMIYLAAVLASPRATMAALWASRMRVAVAVALVPTVLGLVLWFLPAGYPGFNW